MPRYPAMPGGGGGGGGGNGEVRVEKVDKLVRLAADPHHRVCSREKELLDAGGGGAAAVGISRTGSGTKLVRGAVASPEDIHVYLARKKWEFLHGV